MFYHIIQSNSTHITHTKSGRSCTYVLYIRCTCVLHRVFCTNIFIVIVSALYCPAVLCTLCLTCLTVPYVFLRFVVCTAWELAIKNSTARFMQCLSLIMWQIKTRTNYLFLNTRFLLYYYKYTNCWNND